MDLTSKASITLNKYGHAFWLFFICVVTYSNSFSSGFLLDDYVTLFIRRDLPVADFLQLTPQSSQTHIYFRPVFHLLNILTFRLFGDVPQYYFLFNLFQFWLCSLTVYTLISKIAKNNLTAFLTALFFCVHPINGVLVNFKNATGFCTEIIFMNLGLIYFLKFREQNHNGPHVASLVFFILALLCHETAGAFPFYLAAVLYFVGQQDPKKITSGLFPFFITLVLYLVFRHYAMSLTRTLTETLASFHFSGIEYLAALGRLLFWYLEKLVTMQGIVLIWEAGAVGAHTHILIAGLILSLVMALVLISKLPRKRPEGLFLSWMVIGFAPVTLACLTRPVYGYYIEPHWLFIPSIAFFALVSCGLADLQKRIGKKTWLVLTGWLIFVQVFFSIEYNYLWANQKRYCLYWREHAPRNYWANHWLGLTYLADKEYGRAEECFLGMIRQGIDRKDVYGNLAIAEFYLQNYDKSASYFGEVLKRSPGDKKAIDYLRRIRKQTYE